MNDISAEELNGEWNYSCELVIPGTYFPMEFINGNSANRANRHGGVVTFEMFEKNNVELRGRRLWRNVKGNQELHEDITPAKNWLSLYAVVFPDYQLLYQYHIDETNVTGISHVHLLRTESGDLVMNGWFYYVPSADLLDKVNNLEHYDVKKLQKAGTEWLDLFGRVTLTKKIVK